jgi:bifunctional non-homologous end joining protein LigD
LDRTSIAKHHDAMFVAPMLATSRRWRGTTAGWAFEPKFDGWRTVVYVDDAVRVTTRSGNDITAAVPELEPLVDVLPSGVVLDGELVAGQGRATDFYRLGPRLSARRPLAVALKRAETPLTFVAFDVLWLDGSTVDLPWVQRRELLEGLALNHDSWCTAPVLRGTIELLLEVCAEHDLEGVVAKRMTSRYRPGERSADWVKIKTPTWREQHAPWRREREAALT